MGKTIEKEEKIVAVWRGEGVEITVWFISWKRPERKESGSVDGSKYSNHLCGSFHGKDQREGRVDGGAGIDTMRPISRKGIVKGCRRNSAFFL